MIHSCQKLPYELLMQFFNLAVELSPENLYQDGERSREQAATARRIIMKEWRRLEEIAGRTVNEEEIWVSIDEVG
jgi:protein-disulfide isomerase-like protein with CxxC motif